MIHPTTTVVNPTTTVMTTIHPTTTVFTTTIWTLTPHFGGAYQQGGQRSGVFNPGQG